MKDNFGLSINTLKALAETLKKFENEIENVIIFGSRAIGNFKRGSDVDIALKGKQLDFDKILKIRTILNQKILSPYKFDIVHYDKINNEQLKQHIDRFGKEFNWRKFI